MKLNVELGVILNLTLRLGGGSVFIIFSLSQAGEFLL
jgi:hypothetical protein